MLTTLFALILTILICRLTQVMNQFSKAELDYLLCAIIKQQTEFRSRLPIIEKFASAEHVTSHRAKIALGEKLLKEFIGHGRPD